MHRSLIVARIIPDAEQQVAQVFAESDQTELPELVGVRHRSLYRLHDLYVHLFDTAEPGGAAVEAVRQHPEFIKITERLDRYITPYLPTWREPKDAVAHCFYRWDAPTPAARVVR